MTNQNSFLEKFKAAIRSGDQAKIITTEFTVRAFLKTYGHSPEEIESQIAKLKAETLEEKNDKERVEGI